MEIVHNVLTYNFVLSVILLKVSLKSRQDCDSFSRALREAILGCQVEGKTRVEFIVRPQRNVDI